MPANLYQTDGRPPNRYLASMVWYKCHIVIIIEFSYSDLYLILIDCWRLIGIYTSANCTKPGTA